VSETTFLLYYSALRHFTCSLVFCLACIVVFVPCLFLSVGLECYSWSVYFLNFQILISYGSAVLYCLYYMGVNSFFVSFPYSKISCFLVSQLTNYRLLKALYISLVLRLFRCSLYFSYLNFLQILILLCFPVLAFQGCMFSWYKGLAHGSEFCDYFPPWISQCILLFCRFHLTRIYLFCFLYSLSFIIFYNTGYLLFLLFVISDIYVFFSFLWLSFILLSFLIYFLFSFTLIFFLLFICFFCLYFSFDTSLTCQLFLFWV
jgi:hypothetical protein